MAAGLGRDEILSLLAGGALAVPALVGAGALLLTMGQAPTITHQVTGLAARVVPGMKAPGPAPTPMAIPGRARPPSLPTRPTVAPRPAVRHAARPAAAHHPARPAAAHHPAAPTRPAALAAMRIGHDDARGLTWYADRSTAEADRSATGVHCYIAQAPGKRPDLRLRFRYVQRGSVVPFQLKAIYVEADGRGYLLDNPPFGLLGVHRDVSVIAEQTWEWFDTDVGKERLAMLRRLARASEAKVRFTGEDRRHDHAVTAAEKAAIGRVLAAYEALGSGG